MTNGTQNPRTASVKTIAHRSRDLLKVAGKTASARKHSFESVVAAFTHSLALTIDHALAAAGIAAAIGSATFAGYMITHDNSHRMFEGAEYLMLFAGPLGAGSHPNEIGAGAEERPVDLNVTGSIAHQGLADPGERQSEPEPQSNNDQI